LNILFLYFNEWHGVIYCILITPRFQAHGKNSLNSVKGRLHFTDTTDRFDMDDELPSWWWWTGTSFVESAIHTTCARERVKEDKYL
jgi:hypothetical protein